MRPIIFYLLSLLVVGLSACSQDPTTGTTSVSGQVVEYQTKKPVGQLL
jgi:uncharacterized membrane protein